MFDRVIDSTPGITTSYLVTAKRVELKRSAEATGFHEAYFKGPITFGARRNALVLHATDLDRPFLTHNAELLDMLNPQLERALEERRAQSSIREQVKWLLKRLLAGSRPERDVTEVAFLLGYQDSNSFYRAFRTWEGTTPSQLRAALRRSETRQ
jgi:AraC-like DNA-binding protein